MPLSTASWGEGSPGQCTGPGAGVAEAFGTGPREARRLEGSEEGTGEREGRAGHAGPCNAGEQLGADSRADRKLLEAFKSSLLCGNQVPGWTGRMGGPERRP